MTAATRAQIGKLHAVLGELGVTERSAKLRAVAAVIYREIDTTNDLTRDEAHVCIDTLQAMVGRPDELARFVRDVENRASA